MRHDERALLWGGATLVLTIAHHVWGANLYDTPERLHAVQIAIVAMLLMLGGSAMHRVRGYTGLGVAGLWTSRVSNVTIIVLFGAVEGFYNHVLKNLLYVIGVSEGAMRVMFRSPLFEMPNDVVFEVTGVLQAATAFVAGLAVVSTIKGRGSWLARANTFALSIVRVTGPVQVVFGLFLWIGFARGLLVLHIATGVTLVCGLWLLAALAVATGSRTLGLFAVALGAFTIWFGMMHPAILPGRLHWVVRVVHLATGFAAMATANKLANIIRDCLAEPGGGREANKHLDEPAVEGLSSASS